MPDNPITDIASESPYPDDEEWQVAFEPFQGHPQAALQLGFHLTALKGHIEGLRKTQALETLDCAIDQLYLHSDFRSVSLELFRVAITGELTTDKEEALRYLGVKI
jgi:hypothetical protein